MSSIARKARATRVAIFFTLALVFSLAAFSQQPKHPLNNEDILKMAKGGFTDEVMVALIESNDTDFDVSITGLTALKEAGISSKVMEAMLKAEARKRQGGNAPASNPAPSAQQTWATPPSAPPQQNMVANPAASAMGGGNSYAQAMIASALASSGMGGGMPGMLDTNQLPPLTLLVGDARQSVRPSIAQVAHTDTKGDSMPGVGSGARSMLMGLGMQALRFSAISGGSMFAGPGAGMAMSMMGGLGGGRHHGPPKVTYVWALPGLQSAFVVPSSRPRFELRYGELVGIDPDAYEPFLVRLVNSKDNWRLVGATKSTQGQMGTEAYEKVTEERIAVKAEHLGRGQVQIEPLEPLEPGEYAVVLRALHPGKRSAGSLGGGAETSIFFSVWDFSVRSDAAKQ
jgi:hypothetical protein